MKNKVYAYVKSECCTITDAVLPGSFVGRNDEPVHKHGDYRPWQFGKRETLVMMNLEGAHNAYRRRCARLVAELLDWREPAKFEGMVKVEGEQFARYSGV